MLYKKNSVISYCFIAPLVVFAAVFLLYPFVVNIGYMFFSFKYPSDTNPIFVGFENFVSLFTKDEFFARSLYNTAILVAFVMIFQVGLALVLALLVNSLKKFQHVYRTLFFIPIVISATALGTMYFMFGYYGTTPEEQGVFNKILMAFGGQPRRWLSLDSWFGSLVYVMLPVIWQYIGFYFVIFLTGLAGIPDDIIEAARMDGANGVRLQVRIIMPMLWNVFRTCMVLAITGALKVFDLPHVIARGGAPSGTTFFMGTFNYSLYSVNYRMGECAVYSVIIVITGIVVSQISNRLFRQNNDL